MNTNKHSPVIGLEVHVELKTKSKMFCGCSADYFGQKPNSYTCPVCLGLPGALPLPNKKAIEWCILIGLALNCKIPLFSKFDRKNYFYPDLPKGYQISQYEEPFCIKGWINIQNSKKIRIRRVHMEEDTGKLLHEIVDGERISLIDFNRSGVPLVEVVTDPDFESGVEVVDYLKKLQQIVRFLGVSDADMEKGQMRLEPNVSLQKRNITNTTNKQILPNYKVEVKNINSFRFAEKAIDYEINRQKKVLESGKIPIQETRGWDEKKQTTVSQRSKEEAHDYRYFPEPDIPPIRWTTSQISNLKSQIGEMPEQKSERFQKDFGLTAYDSEILTREKSTSDYFEETIRVSHKASTLNDQVLSKKIANYIINRKININKITPSELIKLITENDKKTQLDENKLSEVINQVLSENQKAVEDYRSGKVQVIGFLIGKVRMHFQKADSNQIRNAIEESLKK
ncbi:MAG: Asp-tRNA(Asn)/Glu-tRNA(Gln) amidotransferase subunit GatB [Candidatus Levybacteria bacterium]|nr:Asp-tRNA(Asn)/Glu-tRNA(Gln) amidotransferase subunit GatB [Candidatus Levybacteria bacterium]